MNKIDNKSNDHKFFTITPQIVWAYSKDPYEYTLWCVIKSIAGDAGECYLSTEDLATLAMMSTGKVSQCRKSLMDTGLLQGEVRKDPGYPQPVWHLKIPDVWQANIEWATTNSTLKAKIEFKASQFLEIREDRKSLHLVKAQKASEKDDYKAKEPSPHEGGTSPHEGGTSLDENGTPPGETNKNKNNIENDNRWENQGDHGNAIDPTAQPAHAAAIAPAPLPVNDESANVEQAGDAQSEKAQEPETPAAPVQPSLLDASEATKDFPPAAAPTPAQAPLPIRGGAERKAEPEPASAQADLLTPPRSNPSPNGVSRAEGFKPISDDGPTGPKMERITSTTVLRYKKLVDSPYVDNSKFINGFIPDGMGATSIEVYYEFQCASTKKDQIGAKVEDSIRHVVTDLARWREVVQSWQIKGYNMKNIGGMLEWYRQGIPFNQKGNANGTTNNRPSGQRFDPNDNNPINAETGQRRWGPVGVDLSRGPISHADQPY